MGSLHRLQPVFRAGQGRAARAAMMSDAESVETADHTMASQELPNTEQRAYGHVRCQACQVSGMPGVRHSDCSVSHAVEGAGDLAYLLRVAQRHVMQPAGSSHGVTDRRAWEPAEHSRHARRLSQTKDADWVSAAWGWGVQRGAASVLWHWGEIHHA